MNLLTLFWEKGEILTGRAQGHAALAGLGAQDLTH